MKTAASTGAPERRPFRVTFPNFEGKRPHTAKVYAPDAVRARELGQVVAAGAGWWPEPLAVKALPLTKGPR